VLRELSREDPGQRRKAEQEWSARAQSLFNVPTFGGQAGNGDMLLTLAFTTEDYLAGRASMGFNAVGPDTQTACVVSQFLKNGRQTFRFDPDLAEELAHTDVDDVATSFINLPYDAVYLEFGDCSTLNDGQIVEGMIVERRTHTPEPMISITPFVRHDDGAMALPMTVLSIGGANGNETVGEALARTIRYYEKPSDVAVDSDGPVTPEMLKENPAFQESNGNFAAGIRTGAEVVRSLLPLVINGLFYIDNCLSGATRRWDPNAPEGLALKADSTRPGARKAQQELTRLGWTRITLCTLEDDSDEVATLGTSASSSSRAQPRGHWRRGHWRHQRHGPQNALVRLIRIRPVRVKGREGGERKGYHVSAS
jgi:hypothetical protein